MDLEIVSIGCLLLNLLKLQVAVQTSWCVSCLLLYRNPWRIETRIPNYENLVLSKLGSVVLPVPKTCALNSADFYTSVSLPPRSLSLPMQMSMSAFRTLCSAPSAAWTLLDPTSASAPGGTCCGRTGECAEVNKAPIRLSQLGDNDFSSCRGRALTHCTIGPEF